MRIFVDLCGSEANPVREFISAGNSTISLYRSAKIRIGLYWSELNGFDPQKILFDLYRSA